MSRTYKDTLKKFNSAVRAKRAAKKAKKRRFRRAAEKWIEQYDDAPTESELRKMAELDNIIPFDITPGD